MKPTILVVDDELSIRESFKLILSDNYRLIVAASGEAAVKYAVDEQIDLTYLDIRMPGIDGLETLKRIKDVSPDTEVIMVTAVNDVQKAAQAVKIGARDYVVKPFDVEKILKLTADLLTRRGLIKETKKISYKMEETGLIGSSNKIEKVRQNLEEAAKKTGGVVIMGEAGVEKERAARSLLEFGGHFVMVDLKSLSPGMVERTLFGERKGQSLSELEKKEGAVEEAADGLLFIDNVELMPGPVQEMLAKFDLKGRLVLGTTQNLKETGFNQELWSRASETIIEIPPLKQRMEDVPLLLDHFLEHYSHKYLKKTKGFSNAAREVLLSYGWPGNTRELERAVENMLLTSGPTVEVEDLPLKEAISLPADDLLSRFEKEYIAGMVKKMGKPRAADMLNVKLSYLESKLS